MSRIFFRIYCLLLRFVYPILKEVEIFSSIPDSTVVNHNLIVENVLTLQKVIAIMEFMLEKIIHVTYNHLR